jgi:hypothetical protein
VRFLDHMPFPIKSVDYGCDCVIVARFGQIDLPPGDWVAKGALSASADQGLWFESRHSDCYKCVGPLK